MAELDDGPDYESLYDAIGYRFIDVELLELALTHRSWSAENPGDAPNERLEFLGDAVLGLAVTDALYRNQPDQSEGDLAKARAEVVSSSSLADVARRLELGRLLRVGKGEEQTGGRDKDSILTDAIEAVFGAIYLDGGWKTAHRVVDSLLAGAVVSAQHTPGVRDHKTRLQELAAEKSLRAPEYRIEVSGPDHGREFHSTVVVGAVTGAGRGTSKKQAQQRAAEDALGQLTRSVE